MARTSKQDKMDAIIEKANDRLGYYVEVRDDRKLLMRSFRRLLDACTVTKYTAKTRDYDEYTETLVRSYVSFVGADDAGLGRDGSYDAVDGCLYAICGYKLRLNDDDKARRILERLDNSIAKVAIRPYAEYDRLRHVGIITHLTTQEAYNVVVNAFDEMGLLPC